MAKRERNKIAVLLPSSLHKGNCLKNTRDLGVYSTHRNHPVSDTQDTVFVCGSTFSNARNVDSLKDKNKPRVKKKRYSMILLLPLTFFDKE